MQDSLMHESLRGIHYVGNGVAWASGTNGTVLRTEDMGYLWQKCAVPPGAEKLDFRGVQAFDANTAIVMSSGKGDLSRLYKTTDGCATWKLVFTNPDKDGFFDAMTASRTGDTEDILLLGDPVDGAFKVFCRIDDDTHVEECMSGAPANAAEGEGVFAASNSSVIWSSHRTTAFFATGGKDGARIFRMEKSTSGNAPIWKSSPMPMFGIGDSAGIFSLAKRTSDHTTHLIAVGGDYKQPEDAEHNAAYTRDDGLHWLAVASAPHGYRSSVAYDEKLKTWITVGPNGTDVSFDDGRNWQALRPGAMDQAGADRDWNALSLPFVVGPDGRVGILRDAAVGEARKSFDAKSAKDAKVTPR
ncbi:WD40/YVTN/BNR-like repeat-containing protein [Granulicella cerasi]|uniref:WD40/YVTN/BNR-like repeat-containing protein n=2 Tax=Granulicella cerasi TaxID=741063 RepID=A0ABW1ZEJ7_9BACT